jgi:hypothetical protein
METWGTCWAYWKWEKLVGLEANLGRGWGSWGLRVGSQTHFSVGHLGESGSLKWQVLEILVHLGWGTEDLRCLIGKWKVISFKDWGWRFGLVDRRVGFWILRFGDWWWVAAERKIWEIGLGKRVREMHRGDGTQG